MMLLQQLPFRSLRARSKNKSQRWVLLPRRAADDSLGPLWSSTPHPVDGPVHSDRSVSVVLHRPSAWLCSIHTAEAFTVAWARGCLRVVLAQIEHANAPALLARNGSWPRNEPTDCVRGGGVP